MLSGDVIGLPIPDAGPIFAAAGIRWHDEAHLFAIAVVALSLRLYGYRARKRHVGRATSPPATAGQPP
jgi:hypothetical protein